MRGVFQSLIGGAYSDVFRVVFEVDNRQKAINVQTDIVYCCAYVYIAL